MTEYKPEDIPIIERPRQENFSDVPLSIAELRARKDQRCDRWTPRDVLINLLRAIDAGWIKPDAIVAVYRQPSEETGHETHFVVSGPDIYVLAGLLARGSYLLNKN